MKDELSHRREVELAQAKSRVATPPPLLDGHVKVRMLGSVQLLFSIYVNGPLPYKQPSITLYACLHASIKYSLHIISDTLCPCICFAHAPSYNYCI